MTFSSMLSKVLDTSPPANALYSVWHAKVTGSTNLYSVFIINIGIGGQVSSLAAEHLKFQVLGISASFAKMCYPGRLQCISENVLSNSA